MKETAPKFSETDLRKSGKFCEQFPLIGSIHYHLELSPLKGPGGGLELIPSFIRVGWWVGGGGGGSTVDKLPACC